MKNDGRKFDDSAIVLGFGNLKGGVGKSKISIETAYILSKYYGLDVLFINNDKQVNSSRFFEADESKTLADVFEGEVNIDDVIQPTRYPRIDVIASNMSLAAANLSALQNPHAKQHEILKEALLPIMHKYNFIVIDNPPDINLSVFNGLAITNDLIAVATPDVFSLEGLKILKEQIDDVREYNRKLKVRGCIINKFVPTSNTYQMIDCIKREMPLFNTYIRYTKDKVDASTNNRLSIYEYSNNCGFAMDMRKFVIELLGMGF